MGGPVRSTRQGKPKGRAILGPVRQGDWRSTILGNVRIRDYPGE